MATASDGYFDLSPTDRSMAILDRSSPVAFHVIWDLVGDVDLEALARSWQALATLHPILGCRLEVDVDDRWRHDELPLPFEVVDGPIDEFTAREIGISPDVTTGPPVRLSVVRQPDRVRLILGAHHAAMDGVASVVLLDDLRQTYLALVSTGRLPEMEADLGPRSARMALRSRSGGDRLGTAMRNVDRWRKQPSSTHADPGVGEDWTATGFETIDMGPALQTMDELRRHNSWPVDAVLVGILEAAWTEVFGAARGPSVWLIASDLRPGLGINRGVGNLSGTEPVAIRKPGLRPVAKVIEQAASEMSTWKSDSPGLGPEVMARSWSWLPPAVLNQGVETMIRSGRRQRFTRTLSNLGRLPASLSDWGQAQMEDIRFLGPMSKGPYNSFIAFAHGSSSRVTTRVAPGWLTSAHVSEMKAAIQSLCDAKTA